MRKLKQGVAVWVAVLSFQVGLSVVPSAAQDGQSTFRGNPRHTGVYDTRPLRRFTTVQWATATHGPIRSTVAVAAGTAYFGSGDQKLYAVNLQDGQVRWTFKTEGAVASSPAVAAETVFFTSRDQTLYAVAAGNGQRKWAFAMGADLPYHWAFDYYLSSPLVAEGVVYVGSGDGHVYAVDAQTGQRRWAFDAGARVRSSPALADGLLYVGAMDGRFYALDSRTGEQRWVFETEGSRLNPADFGFDRQAILSSPAIVEGVVVFGGRDGFLYALDRHTGAERWRFDHEVSWVVSSPAVADGVVYAGSSDGRFLQAVDLATGAERWRFETPSVVWSSPVVAGAMVYFGCADGHLFALDRERGEEVWRFQTREAIWASPLILDGVVYIGSDDGTLYALAGASAAAPRPARPERAVFWEEGAGLEGGERVRDFLEQEGYAVVDAAALARFMTDRTADRHPSVVVFAAAKVPSVVVADTSEAALLRRYLDAGGKVVWINRAPLAFVRNPETGAVVGLDFSIPERILGIAYGGRSSDGFRGYYGARVTADGVRWGLQGWWVGCCSVDPANVTTVLARDEFGWAAAWVKRYGGPEGTGLVQMWNKAAAPDDLVAVKAVAEYGLR